MSRHELCGNTSGGMQKLLQKIANAKAATYLALLSDPNCLSFLSGGLSALTNTPIVPTGYGGAGKVAATVQTPSTTPGGNSTFQININESSSFFQSGGFYQGYKGGPVMAGGSPRLQGFVLLHELGHITGALQPDGTPSNPDLSMESKNNKAIQSNCKNALSSLSNTAPK